MNNRNPWAFLVTLVLLTAFGFGDENSDKNEGKRGLSEEGREAVQVRDEFLFPEQSSRNIGKALRSLNQVEIEGDCGVNLKEGYWSDENNLQQGQDQFGSAESDGTNMAANHPLDLTKSEMMKEGEAFDDGNSMIEGSPGVGALSSSSKMGINDTAIIIGTGGALPVAVAQSGDGDDAPAMNIGQEQEPLHLQSEYDKADLRLPFDPNQISTNDDIYYYRDPTSSVDGGGPNRAWGRHLAPYSPADKIPISGELYPDTARTSGNARYPPSYTYNEELNRDYPIGIMERLEEFPIKKRRQSPVTEDTIAGVPSCVDDLNSQEINQLSEQQFANFVNENNGRPLLMPETRADLIRR